MTNPLSPAEITARARAWVEYGHGKTLPPNSGTSVGDAFYAGWQMGREGLAEENAYKEVERQQIDIAEGPARMAQATQIAMGHGKVTVGPIYWEGRTGLLFHPTEQFIPVGQLGVLQNQEFWPRAGDVVIWLDGPERGQIIINELIALPNASTP